MSGNGYIVVSIDRPMPSSGRFFEHPTIEDAKKEAARLALLHGGTFVIYEPFLVCRPTPPVQWSSPRPEENDDLLF